MSSKYINWENVHAPSNNDANSLYAVGLDRVSKAVSGLTTTADDFQKAVKNGIQEQIMQTIHRYNPADFYNENREKTLSDIHNYLKHIDDQSGGEVTKEMWNIADEFGKEKIIQSNQLMVHAQDQEKQREFEKDIKAKDLFYKAVGSGNPREFIKQLPDEIAYRIAQQLDAHNQNMFEVQRKEMEYQDMVDNRKADELLPLYEPMIDNLARHSGLFFSPLYNKDAVINEMSNLRGKLLEKPEFQNLTASQKLKLMSKFDNRVFEKAKTFAPMQSNFDELMQRYKQFSANHELASFNSRVDAEYKAQQTAIDMVRATQGGNDSSNNKENALVINGIPINKKEQEIIDKLNRWNGGNGWLNLETGKLNPKAMVSGLHTQITPYLDGNRPPMTDAELISELSANEPEWQKVTQKNYKKSKFSTSRTYDDILDDVNAVKNNIPKLKQEYGLTNDGIFRLVQDIYTNTSMPRFTFADGLFNRLGGGGVVNRYKSVEPVKQLKNAKLRQDTIQGNLLNYYQLGYTQPDIAEALIQGDVTPSSIIFNDLPLTLQSLIKEKIGANRLREARDTIATSKEKQLEPKLGNGKTKDKKNDTGNNKDTKLKQAVNNTKKDKENRALY